MTQPLTFDITKAHITVTPPDVGVRFALISDATKGTVLPDAGRKAAFNDYYRMYRQHPIVRAAVDKIAKTAASTALQYKPEDTQTNLDAAQVKRVRAFMRRSNIQQLLLATFIDLLIFGEAYWWIEWRPGLPWRAKRLVPKYVDIRMADDKRTVTGYRYGPITADSVDEYDTRTVIPFRIEDPDNDLYGLSRLESLKTTVATDLFAMDYNGSFFENNAQTGIIFQIQSASETELKRNRAWLEEHYVGTKNAHRPLLLEGDVEVKPSVSNHGDMQFIEGRRLNREEILAVLDVPPEKLGFNADSNRSTAKENSSGFRGESVRPLQAIVETELSNNLILRLFNFVDLICTFSETDPADEMANLKLITEAQSNGLLNIDEGRARLGYGNVDGGEIYFVQTSAGLIPVDLLKEIAQTALEQSKLNLKQTERLANAPLPAFQGGPGQPGQQPGQPGVQPAQSGGGGMRPRTNPSRPGTNSDKAKPKNA